MSQKPSILLICFCLFTSPLICETAADCSVALHRVHTGQGKLEKVREFEWSGKVRESQGKCKSNWKVRGKILPFCTAVVLLIIVELESNPPYC